MAVEDTTIQEELNRIFISNELPVNSKWECNLIVNGETQEVHKVISIDIDRNYHSAYSDTVMVSLSLPLGLFDTIITDNLDNVLVELTRVPLKEDGTLAKDKTFIRKYKALPLDVKSNIIASSRSSSFDSETTKLLGFETKEFQLFDIRVEQSRKFEVGGIFRNVIPGDVIKYILTDVSENIKGDFRLGVDGVDIVDYDNKESIKQLVIPHGIPVYDIPSYIQENCGGVYGSGIGCYLQDSIWYVWPLFNTGRYTDEQKTLRLFNLPFSRYPGVERTYELNGSELVVLSTGEATHLDESLTEVMAVGNGVRYKSANIWNSNVTNSNKTTLKRKSNTREIRLEGTKGTLYAPVVNTTTLNDFKMTSTLSKRKGSLISVVWENSKVDLIYPGMPVKFHYLKDNEIQTLMGTVVSTKYQIYDSSIGPIQHKHITNSVITIFVNS